MASKNTSLLRFKLDDSWKDLERALRELGDDKAIKQTLRRAMLKAAAPIEAAAQAAAPKRSGNMAEGVAVSTTLSRRQRAQRRRGRRDPGEVELFIGARPRGPAVLAEFGTKPRYQKSTVPARFTGSMPATPFMRPAWEAGKDQILPTLARELGPEIEKTARRLARKAQRKAKKK